MAHKELFSSASHAKAYVAFRPLYPQSLYSFLFSQVNNFNRAWDCATGNGQVATVLAKHFTRVHATDVSIEQINNAIKTSNIDYGVCPAEKTNFDNATFDLVTVGQALHWFDRPEFYREVKRVVKPGGVIAAWGYSFLSIEPKVDTILLSFYEDIVGPYWDVARKLVEQKYETIEFPFQEIEAPPFFIEVDWSVEQLVGYISSWSATQKYIKVHDVDPVQDLKNHLHQHWGKGEIKQVSFPVFMRVGKV